MARASSASERPESGAGTIVTSPSGSGGFIRKVTRAAAMDDLLSRFQAPLQRAIRVHGSIGGSQRSAMAAARVHDSASRAGAAKRPHQKSKLFQRLADRDAQRTDPLDLAFDSVAGHRGGHAGRRAGHDDVAGG